MDEISGDRLGQELSTAVVLLHEELGRAVGLSAADHKALGLVRREGPLPLGRFAQQLGVVPSAATAIADRLERAGHVERAPDPEDRRRIRLVALTAHDPGSSLEAQVFGQIGRGTAEFLETLAPDQLDAVLTYIRLTTQLLTEARHELRARAEP